LLQITLEDLLKQNIQMETKRIMFLDIDGVLNCDLFYQGKQFADTIRQAKTKLKKAVKSNEITSDEYYNRQICRERIRMLNELCSTLDIKVVVSSSWRLGRSFETLQNIFTSMGATFEIIGVTPFFHGIERGAEISKWLKDNITLETYGVHSHDFYDYVIIDDDNDMLLTQAPHFFHIDKYNGLTPTVVNNVRIFFTKKQFDF
jgi:hypothetical protein